MSVPVMTADVGAWAAVAPATVKVTLRGRMDSSSSPAEISAAASFVWTATEEAVAASSPAVAAAGALVISSTWRPLSRSSRYTSMTRLVFSSTVPSAIFLRSSVVP